MVASPEVCRLNKAKSKGPKTARGKAIAARNTTKQRRLPKQPPLLGIKDLTTFEELAQQLPQEIAPSSFQIPFNVKREPPHSYLVRAHLEHLA